MEYRNKFKQDLLEASKDVTEAPKKGSKGKKKAKVEEPEKKEYNTLEDDKKYHMILLGTGQEFYSTLNEIRAICGDINTDLLSEMVVTVNDFADKVDIEHTKHGDKIGWDVSRNKAEIISYWPCLDEKTNEFFVKVDLNDAMLFEAKARW